MNTTLKKKLVRISKLPPTTHQLVLAALIASLFKEHDIQMTLVGGAAVQFYTQAEYVTGDIDVILQGDDTETIEEVMAALDFKRTTTFRHFENELFGFVVEFPPSPIEIGDRTISSVSIIETEEGPIRVVRIEDIIMDRLIAAEVWRDRPSLDQAKLLWRKNKDQIDQKYLTQFAKEEGCLSLLKEIKKT